MNVRNKIFRKLSSFSREYLQQYDHFVCVYGSCASGYYCGTSDIDVFIFVEQYNVEILTKSIDFLTDLHVQCRLNIDNEVPYANKLVVSYQDVVHAINLRPFFNANGECYVPPIEKTEKFLSSKEIRWRLILNALTSPHRFISGNKEKYLFFKVEAEKSITRLSYKLMNTPGPTLDDLVRRLLFGVHGEEGEMYLGYKNERKKIVKYLRNIIKRNSVPCKI